MPTVTSFDGLSVNAATDYAVIIEKMGTQSPYAMTPQLRERTNQNPVVDRRSYGARPLPFTIARAPGSALSAAQFAANVERYFTPWAGPRTLNATHDDGSTTLTATADVVSLVRTAPLIYEGQFLVPEGAWRSTSINTDSASPLIVAGTYKALPTITITPSTSTLKRRRISITDNTGRGLAAYIIQATFDSTGVSATANTNYVVFFQGRSIPFYVNTPNNASTKLYFRVDVQPSATATVDVYYGSSVSNSVTNDKLDDAGMALTSGTFSNTQWEWDAPFTISTNPRGAAGSFVAAKLGNQPSNIGFGILSEAAAEVQIAFASNGTGANDVDGFVVTVPAGAGTTNALSNLKRDDINTPTGTYTFYIKYRIAGQLNWTTAWSSTGLGAGVTTAVDLDNAVEIAFYAEATANASFTADWLTSGGNLTLALNSSYTPTVSVDSATTARYINSTLTNTTSGDTITFTDVYLDDVALTIATQAKTITVASGPIYGSISMSEPDCWMALPTGSNSWTDPTNAASSFGWADRFLI